MPLPASPTVLPATPGAAAPSARLRELKARASAPGRASHFWFDAHFARDAVKVLPGEYFVDGDDLLMMTTLGSCIAACLWDGSARVGGMNHFMLPDGHGDAGSGRYGAYAMELLINELLKIGARRERLEAKVFGGAAVIAGMDSLAVGERNTRFVLDYLRTERIAVVGKDVLDIHPRKVCFLPASGKALVKRLAPTQLAQQRERELRSSAATAAASAGGSVDLF